MLGLILDFLSILLTGINAYYYFDMTLEGFYFSFSLYCAMWIPFISIFAVYLGVELLELKKKWYIMSVYIFLGLIYEIAIFFDPQGSGVFVFPINPGENLIKGYFRFGSVAYFLLIIFYGTLFFFLGFAFLYKGIQSTGVIRRKYFFLAIGDFTTAGFASIELFFYAEVLVIVFLRILIIIGFIFKYVGIKEIPAEPKKKRSKKEIKVEESLFMISKRPARLTEEEITVSKEKRICLVCKGKVARKMYMCPECNTFYCENCSDALANLENACWVCNAPIDESKPSKAFEPSEKEKITVEDSKNSKKESKLKKTPK